LDKRVVLPGLLAPAILLCALASARAGETTIGVTLNPTIGAHSEEPNDRQTLPVVPAPIFSLEYETGRFAFFLEGLPPIGPVAFNGTSVSHATGTKISLFDGAARYAFANSRVWIGLGETVINQATTYRTVSYEGSIIVPPDPVVYPVTNILDRRDASRVVGARYEIGADLWKHGGQRLELSMAVSPTMHARLDRWFASTDVSDVPGWPTPHYEASQTVAEQASLVDGQVRWSLSRGRSIWSLGVRYVNHVAKFDNGTLADRNTLILPFVGWAARI